VSTRLLHRSPVRDDREDVTMGESWAGLDWTVVKAPRPAVAEGGIRDLTAPFWGAPAQHPAPTPVIGRGQVETAGLCDYPTVARTRTRTRPGR
jgi:hypothetical protein